jgi:hypothetical protein
VYFRGGCGLLLKYLRFWKKSNKVKICSICYWQKLSYFPFYKLYVRWPTSQGSSTKYATSTSLNRTQRDSFYGHINFLNSPGHAMASYIDVMDLRHASMDTRMHGELVMTPALCLWLATGKGLVNQARRMAKPARLRLLARLIELLATPSQGIYRLLIVLLCLPLSMASTAGTEIYGTHALDEYWHWPIIVFLFLERYLVRDDGAWLIAA